MRTWKTYAAMILFAVSAGAFAARSPVPILQIEKAPVQSVDGKPLTLEQIRKAIIQAGATRQWSASQQPNNVVRLSYSRGNHGAVVDVSYSTTSYSIRYVNSTEMNYSGTGDSAIIHPNYNNWVINLRKAIDIALKTV